MKQKWILLLAFAWLAGCGGYNSYPRWPAGGYSHGYGHMPPVNYGYGYASPAVHPYGYYPGPVYYGHPYGGYGYVERAPRPPINNNQKALNYIYDHRNEIKRLPPQQQQQILRQAQKLAQQNNHHHQRGR